MSAFLEHTNISVSDPKSSAAQLCNLFDWQIRWEGPAMNGEGYTVHVGSHTGYVALYSSQDKMVRGSANSYVTVGGLNHIGIVVDDLDATEARVKAAGFDPHTHADYEPGRRFYFHDTDGIEYEVVSYTLSS